MSTEPKALLFDVFGTLVDWRTSIARESELVLKPLGVSVDWLAFADAWRGEYQGAMDQVRDGHIPFCKLDVLHRRNLDRILPRFNISGIAENVLQYLNLAWHRLDAWPDVEPGMALLRRPARDFTSEGFTPEQCKRTRTSPGPGAGSGRSPMRSTSRAEPVFS